MILIDIPSPFAPRSEWKEFREEMREQLRLHPESQEVKDALKEADEVLG